MQTNVQAMENAGELVVRAPDQVLSVGRVDQLAHLATTAEVMTRIRLIISIHTEALLAFRA